MVILINNRHWYLMCDDVVLYNRLGSHTQPFAIWKRPIVWRTQWKIETALGGTNSNP